MIPVLLFRNEAGVFFQAQTAKFSYSQTSGETGEWIMLYTFVGQQGIEYVYHGGNKR